VGITVKTKKEIALLREGGRRLAEILHTVAGEVKAGVSPRALNDLALRLMTVVFRLFATWSAASVSGGAVRVRKR